MYFKAFIDTHGKDVAEELMNMIIFKEKLPHGDEFRTWLIKHGIIKQTTKMINTNGFTTKHMSGYRWDGKWRSSYLGNDKRYVLRASNGRGQYVINTEFFQSDLPQIREYLDSL